MEIIICGAAGLCLLLLYWIFGNVFWRLLGKKCGAVLCLLSGALVYHGLFQIIALPMIIGRRHLSELRTVWTAVVGIVLACWLLFGVRRKKGARRDFHRPQVSWYLAAAAAALALFQIWNMTMTDYLGWDTSAYIGTIATSVVRNSMYLYDGLSGAKEKFLDLRYALSTFYIHSAVWCQILPVTALYYAKIVHGLVLAVLADLTIFELGRFLFSGAGYREKFGEKERTDAALVMMMAAMALHFFYRSIYTGSDFLMKRALEAKSYCANFVLPFVLLSALRLWREGEQGEKKIMLFLACFSSVAVSMSSLVTVPALLAVLFVPTLFCGRTRRTAGLYLVCLLPNLAYLAVYLLYKKGIIGITL